jgi:hypothetical protein
MRFAGIGVENQGMNHAVRIVSNFFFYFLFCVSYRKNKNHTAERNTFRRLIARSGVNVTRLLCDPLPYKNVLKVPHAKIWEKIPF